MLDDAAQIANVPKSLVQWVHGSRLACAAMATALTASCRPVRLRLAILLSSLVTSARSRGEETHTRPEVPANSAPKVPSLKNPKILLAEISVWKSSSRAEKFLSSWEIKQLIAAHRESQSCWFEAVMFNTRISTRLDSTTTRDLQQLSATSGTDTGEVREGGSQEPEKRDGQARHEAREAR